MGEKMNDLISVVIPTYKRNYTKIEKAINSVINQTYNNIEIIVIDDNSDNQYSQEVIKIKDKYPEVKVISNNGNKGACAARNNGILNAKGEFVAFLDDDDEWKMDKLEKQYNKIKSENNIALIYSGISWYYEKEKVYKCKPAIKHENPSKELFIDNFIGSTSCGFVRRSAAIEIGMFDEKLKSGQDLDFWIRMTLNYKIDCVEECLVEYTLYEKDSISSNTINRLLSNIYLKGKYCDFIYQDKELLTIYNLKIIKAYIINKQIISATLFFMKSMLNKEISFKDLFKYRKRIVKRIL